ncbi:bacterial regulatory, arsR family protein [Mycobacterium xenopi 4042]|uniref:Bacterial regulatory, arsR family protein n=1 Tax=Mycobacterium xenopi 4042 TaxID=1299334 RepID=X8ARH6_MYCXE|nr:bacterial regulatory, arsR family protein [Mycobacterium xenopi 4042]
MHVTVESEPTTVPNIAGLLESDIPCPARRHRSPTAPPCRRPRWWASTSGSSRHARPPPREILEATGELLRALAAPVRIAIVLQLRESQRCVHELVDALGVPQPLVSQHLKILKAAGVVAGERSGREVLYRLVDHHLAHIVIDAVAHAGEERRL